jgi:tRNA threonylcarbamoyl adenosine modification protein (Sua5/YciO/YrdC/YwlC family)
LTSRTLSVKDEESCDDVIQEAVMTIRDGGLVVYPTDTSYGIACDPMQEQALGRLIAAKMRDKRVGVPLLFSDFNQCELYHDFGNLERVLAHLFWPGALTLIVTTKDTIPSYITGGRESAAIRVPDHFVPRRIAKGLDSPIVGTSANLSGRETPFEVSVAIEQLGDSVDLYIDGGPSSANANSTIVGVEGTGTEEQLNIKVYREGSLSVEKITESLRVDSDALRFWTNRIIYPDM